MVVDFPEHMEDSGDKADHRSTDHCLEKGAMVSELQDKHVYDDE
jgi:hypothetical protein